MQTLEQEVVIGLEVHVQLNKLNTKLFCSCSTSYHEDEPNTHVCPVCLGLPGAMPVINKEAVKFAVKTALALNAEVQPFTVFDRKNYFYPDLPKGFQISQYDNPLALGGYVTIETDSGEKKITLKRIHMEEDPGKLSYKGSITTAKYSLIDYNRSGMPLLEIVTEPVMHSPKEAREFLNKLRIILEYLDVFDGSLEGAMRVDANISLKGGGRVEIKNISSFKGVERALTYEITRQKNLLRRGRKVERETRHFDEANNITVSLRTKEEEQDYRYFPEPDLVPIYTAEIVEEVKGQIPEMPEEKRDRFISQYGISLSKAKILVLDPKMADYFEEVASKVDSKKAARWIVDVLRGELNYRDKDFRYAYERFPPGDMVRVIEYLENEKITDKSAVEIIRTKLDHGGDVDGIIQEKNLFAIDEEEEILNLCRKAVEENPKAVEDYLSGKKNAINFLVGQVMKATKGRADPAECFQIIKKIIDEKN
ncbi:aspartyl/glutamyl-tRNA(Asn/Gln) amidotransferase subunit B [Archaeoglobus sulfaticallidus PM70-1]|uniref:Aspartyl/glutamyl-tRNA(Asn/Gln) amidotransferase subunit B n=1 Tax=Archaeoglobus sulfaticallidus PM70-1 TaxID=387631 RepID=N0BJB5_9EURY|nr:Asp-tRNA(Asn)/Glu-tRNA(Gln) amidotransferase subunit GatB [Archaeoglobus sulfaticallidus]AGK60546.1 aspartyl/glutamyl-tRNA(Asn/Gln) amidotransferase subunit B [Archaeoglobus sulfaticallidus PM70-1]